MVVKKTQKKEDGMNWGFATLISNGEGFDGKPQMYNGISFDGYATMEQMLESSLYNETMDPLVQKWWENSQKNKRRDKVVEESCKYCILRRSFFERSDSFIQNHRKKEPRDVGWGRNKGLPS